MRGNPTKNTSRLRTQNMSDMEQKENRIEIEWLINN